MTIEGKRIALTGKLRKLSRSDATSQLEDLGAEVTAVVTDGTDLVIAGSDAVVPEDADVPVIDETALEKLLAGAPLSAILGAAAPAAPERPPLPAIKWERDGVYNRFDALGRALVEGGTRRGAMHGTWRYRWPNGQFSREVEMVDGLEQGAEREWNDRGLPTYRGQNARGRAVGACEVLYDNGETVATRIEYRDGEPHGEHLEFHPDGSPRVIGRNVRGRAEGVWAWLAPDGTRMERRYRNGFQIVPPAPIEADEKTIDLVVRGIKKADERWNKEAALEAIPSEGNRFVLLHLVRIGALDLATQPLLWDLLAEAVIDPAGGVTGAELMAILVEISPKAKLVGGHLDGWPQSLDRAVAYLVARDPEPFVAAVRPEGKMAPNIRRGIESVLLRAGLVARSTDLADAMAKALVVTTPLPKLAWFESGDVVERELAVGGHPTPAFDELVALFAAPESWGRASLARACARGVKQLDLDRLHAAAHYANEDQLASMVERAVREDAITAFLLASTLAPDAIARVALGVTAGQRRAVWAALVRYGRAGLAITDELVEAASFVGAAEPAADAFHEQIAALPSHREDEPAVIASLVRFTDESHPLFRGLALPLQAARALGPRLAEVVAGELADHRLSGVAAVFHLLDPARWPSTLATMRAIPTTPRSYLAGVALGMLPVEALPMLVAAHDDETDVDTREWLACAIVAVLAHAASDDAPWPASYDRFLRTDLGETDEERAYLDPLLAAAIVGLPGQRAEAVMLANLDVAQRERFTRAFTLIGAVATARVMQHAFHALLDLEPTLLDADVERVATGLGGLYEPNEWVRWLVAAGAGSRLGSALVAVAGNEEKLAALRDEVAATGARIARVLDSIEVIEAMADRFAEAAKSLVYLLRRVDDAPSDAGFNRIGGVPVGVTARKWPKRKGKPMAHVVTLDVNTMPALAKVLPEDARTVSLFVAQPDRAVATAPGNDATKVLVVSAKDAAKGELAPPSAAPVRPLAWFEPVGVELPSAVFNAKAGTLRELREQVTKHARVLGEPSWIGEPVVHEGTLLAQFDGDFADLELGPRGRMFVFADTAFSQSY